MKVQETIQDKKFMNEFVQIANEAFKMGGDYNYVYDEYEDRFSDNEILELLNYCEENNLLND